MTIKIKTFVCVCVCVCVWYKLKVNQLAFLYSPNNS